MDKIKSRTFWLVVVMLVATGAGVYLEHWPPIYWLGGLVILGSLWIGGKAWQSLLDVIKVWASKGGGA